MIEPLLMSKAIFDSLTAGAAEGDHRGRHRNGGLRAGPARKADDDALAAVYSQAGVKVQDMNADVAGEVARRSPQDTAWKDFAARNACCADLLKLAEAVA